MAPISKRTDLNSPLSVDKCKQKFKTTGHQKAVTLIGSDVERCLLCDEFLCNGEELYAPLHKAMQTIKEASGRRGDRLCESEVFASEVQVVFHKRCREQYTNNVAIERWCQRNQNLSDHNDSVRLRRSQEPTFLVDKQCLLCGEEADESKEKKERIGARKIIHRVESDCEFVSSLLKQAQLRNDSWGSLIIDRMTKIRTHISDLVAAEARYHHFCHGKFFTLDSDLHKIAPRGRRQDESKSAAFEKLCEFLESNDECQYSLLDLQTKLEELGGKENVYGRQYLKAKLMARFKTSIRITENPGRPDVVNFAEAVDNRLYEAYINDKNSTEEDKELAIVKMAANIIRRDICAKKTELDNYPTFEDSACEMHVPQTLRTFLDCVVKTKSKKLEKIKRKKAAIGQAIVSACRSKSYISPILLNIALLIHRVSASRQLIDILCALGLCESYGEVQRFESSACAQEDAGTHDGQFVQYIFDNADSNIRTLDGHGTFHCMGGVRVSTPRLNVSRAPVPRIRRSDALSGLTKSIPLRWYFKPTTPGLKSILVRPLEISEQGFLAMENSDALDYLCFSAEWAGVENAVSWSGFMKTAMSGPAAPSADQQWMASSVEPIPFINMEATNRTTVHTSLSYAVEECRSRGQNVCIVTYDQPLYLKACEIVAHDQYRFKGVIVRLGGFHLLMTFMAAIGTLMEGSGLEELWWQVYARTSATHMLSGTAYARALRAHILTYAALVTLLLQRSGDIPTSLKENVRKMYSDILTNKISPSQVFQSEHLCELSRFVKQSGEIVSNQSRTGKLWWRYCTQVALILNFVRAERTGDWTLHLNTIKKMIPYFHSAGRRNYAKCAHLYVQQMEEIENLVPEHSESEIRKIKSGFFTVRRSEAFWAGIWTDMVIEQDLMRPMKLQGGLTRGRGMSENVIAQWILSSPSLVKVLEDVEKLCGVYRRSSEQHVELRESRRSADQKHFQIFLKWLRSHCPFKISDGIYSVATGVQGSESVNCERAYEVGQLAVDRLIGVSFADFQVKQTDRAITLGTKEKKSTRKEEEHVDTYGIFQRMVALNLDGSALRNCFRHELADQPPSLFCKGMMRRNKKSAIAVKLESEFPSPHLETLFTEETAVIETVIDGGYLLHSVFWPSTGEHSTTFGNVCDGYVKYVLRHYQSSSVTVVFDGYDLRWSTKCEEQKRRMSKRTSPDVEFEEDSEVIVQREEFLGNPRNKTKLIRLLQGCFEERNIRVLQADADADVLIVETALKIGLHGKRVRVVATDTDILVMLIARSPINADISVLHPGNSQVADKLFDITKIKKKIDQHSPSMHECLLFLHAMTGCDTTSALYGRGKLSGWKLLETREDLRSAAKLFSNPEAEKGSIASVGEAFVGALYAGKQRVATSVGRYAIRIVRRENQHVSARGFGVLAPNIRRLPSALVQILLASTTMARKQLGPHRVGMACFRRNTCSGTPPAAFSTS